MPWLFGFARQQGPDLIARHFFHVLKVIPQRVFFETIVESV